MWGVYENKINEDFSEFHVIPHFGPEHERSLECWCHPHRDKETPIVIVHNAEN